MMRADAEEDYVGNMSSAGTIFLVLVCEARRFAKAAAQRRWRNKESLSANG
jgi:hypothetical protein